MDLPVLIVGAGPTGLVLALRLAHHKVPFRIVDKASGPGQASRAMVVQARSLELYDQLDLADEVIAQGIIVETGHLREGGREIATLDFRDLGKGLSPYPFPLCYAQDDHERWLVDKLAALGCSVEWNAALEDFREEGRAIHAKLGTGETCTAGYLAGCDGARSRTREILGLEFPGGTYAHAFYVADVKIAGAHHDELVANLGEGGINLSLPVRRNGTTRLIGMVPDSMRERDDLTFDDIAPHVRKFTGVDVEEVNWFSTYRIHHRVAPSFRVGRAFLAGDAGHIHSPAGGQGMNTGIGDAVNLSWKLAEVSQGRIDASVLDTYESERLPFARKLVASTDKAFAAMVGQGFAAKWTRTWVIPHLAPRLTQMPEVRKTMFRTISQIRINYRPSALSEGKAGDVHGGDRLPWVAMEAGGNFKSLRGLQWRLHVYGDEPPGMREAASAIGVETVVFPWSDAAEQAGIARDATYLIRPDGHVGWASAARDPEGLSAYARRAGLSPPAERPASPG
jgi:2-polyprenyl-6-methoxyphenol hydroxylase-like FAD-dependent oxidoreductase